LASRTLDREVHDRLLYDGMFRYFGKHHPIQRLVVALIWPRRWLASWRRARSGSAFPAEPRERARPRA
jgi:hypothetical protein